MNSCSGWFLLALFFAFPYGARLVGQASFLFFLFLLYQYSFLLSFVSLPQHENVVINILVLLFWQFVNHS